MTDAAPYALPHDVAEPGAIVALFATPWQRPQPHRPRVLGHMFIAEADYLTVKVDNGYERSPCTRFWRSSGLEIRWDGPPRLRIELAPEGTPPPIERGPDVGTMYETWQETVQRVWEERHGPHANLVLHFDTTPLLDR